MNFAVTCIDHQPLKVRLVDQIFKQSFPHSIIAPTDKAPVSVAPTAEVGWQVSPRCTCPHNPENCIYKTPIVMSYTSPTSFAARQMRFKLFPNSIRNIVSSVRWLWHGSSLVIKDK
jgi:hypothetical protein